MKSQMQCLFVIALVATSLACSDCEREWNPPECNEDVVASTATAIPSPKRRESSLSIWIATLASAALVGATGIFPLLLIGLDYSPTKSPSLHRFLLSFAAGGLLGDVFLHILPETWAAQAHGAGASELWIIGGFVIFLVIEKLASESSSSEEKAPDCADVTDTTNASQRKLDDCNDVNGKVRHRTGAVQESRDSDTSVSNGDVVTKVNVSGYLNLAANCADNITHGLALSAAYLLGFKVGVLTTITILLHELPHEIGDFAILLNAGFDHWSAAKAQIATASGGLIGAAAGLIAHDFANTTAWILPFTAGGFVYVSMVTVLPELLKETKFVDTCKQLIGITGGMLLMGAVTFLE